MWTAATSDPTRELIDAGGEKQLERIGRNPEQIEQKRHGRVEAPEEAHQPRERQLRIVGQWHERVREPSREEHEAQREQLPGVREVERGRHDHLREPARLHVAGAEPIEERAAGLREPRQHDEQIAGDEGREERVVRLAENVPRSNRRERGDQAREHPQAHQQRHRDVRHEIDLQAAQLLEIQRARRVRGNRKQAIRGEARDETRGTRDRISEPPAGRRAGARGVRRRPARRRA